MINRPVFLLLLCMLSSSAAYADNSSDAYETAIKLFQLGDKQKAFGVANQLIEKKDSETWGYRLRAELNQRNGRDDLAERDTKKAVDIAINLFELNKDQAPMLGHAHIKSMSEITAQTKVIDQSFSKAMSDADKSLSAKPAKFDLTEIQKAIAKNPRDFQAVFREAAAYRQRGDWKSALKALGRALTLEARVLR